MGFVGSEPSAASVSSAGILDGAIVDADINASAAIAMSKTAFSAGTGITLSTNTLNIDAAQTGITSLLVADIKIGEDNETKIDFEDVNKINFYANNAKEVELAENSLSPGTSDGTALGTTSLMWSDLFLASGSVINFNNGDVTLTHSGNTLTVAGGTLATAALTSTTITASGIIKTDDSTNATSTTDGSLQTDGGLSVVLDAVIGDDLMLLSDSAILSLGAGNDATLTHDGTTGLTIAATPISIDSTGELHLNSTTGDIKLQDGGTDQITFDLDGTAGEVIMKPAVDSDDLVISQYDGTEVIRIEDNASLGLVGNKLSIANSSSDVVIKPLTDAKDIIFQQYDGTEVARIEDNATFNVSSAGKFAYAGTAVTATAAELNLLDGGTSVGGSITLADADGVVVNDGGAMKTIPASDIKSYASGGGTFDAVASGAISAGDLVGIQSDGKVASIVGSYNGTAVSISELIANATDEIRAWNICWDPDNSRAILVWSELSSQYDLLAAVITKNSNGTLTAGTEQVIFNGDSGNQPSRTPQLVYDTNVDRFALIFTSANSTQHNSAIRGQILDIDTSDDSIDTGDSMVIDGLDGGGFGSVDVGAQQRNSGRRCAVFMPSSNHIAVFLCHDRYDSGGNFISASGATDSGAHLTILTAVGGSTNTLTVNSLTQVTDHNTPQGLAWDTNTSRLFGVLQMGAVDDDISAYIIEHDTSDDSITVGTVFDIDDTPSGSTRTGAECIYWAAAQKVFVLWCTASGGGYTKIRGYTVAGSGQSATASSETTTIRTEEQGEATLDMSMAELTAGTMINNLVISYKDYGGTTKYWEIFTYDAGNVGVDDYANGSESSFLNDDTGGAILTDGTTFSVLGLAGDDANDMDYISPAVAPPSTSAAYYRRWCGVANSAISDTATGTITSVGGVGTGQSSLTIGDWYEIDTTGALVAMSESYSDTTYATVGFATSATTIYITGAFSN